jgi:hypothetical protein
VKVEETTKVSSLSRTVPICIVLSIKPTKALSTPEQDLREEPSSITTGGTPTPGTHPITTRHPTKTACLDPSILVRTAGTILLLRIKSRRSFLTPKRLWTKKQTQRNYR